MSKTSGKLSNHRAAYKIKIVQVKQKIYRLLRIEHKLH